MKDSAILAIPPAAPGLPQRLYLVGQHPYADNAFLTINPRVMLGWYTSPEHPEGTPIKVESVEGESYGAGVDLANAHCRDLDTADRFVLTFDAAEWDRVVESWDL